MNDYQNIFHGYSNVFPGKCRTGSDWNSERKFTLIWVRFSGVVANVLDCDMAVNEFELQSNYYVSFRGGARGVMVIVVGNGHGDMSSNPRRG